jgi:lipoate-protein ligase B
LIKERISILNTQGLASLTVENLGVISYDEAYQIQQKRVGEVIRGRGASLFFCEHPLVVTQGRLSDQQNILSEKLIQEQGGSIKSIDRGGDVTLHAPGQLVIYPIIDLHFVGKDLKAYLHNLEQVTIDLLASFGIVAGRFSSRTGVWIKEKKIASMGIGVKKWVAYHGIGLNVNTDLSLFSLIRPCGLDISMTSMARELKKNINMNDVKENFAECFQKRFGFSR